MKRLVLKPNIVNQYYDLDNKKVYIEFVVEDLSITMELKEDDFLKLEAEMSVTEDYFSKPLEGMNWD